MRSKVFKCSDFGTKCDIEFRGANVEEVLAQAKKHAIEVHHLTPAEVDSPAITELIASRVREDDGS